MRRTIVAAAVVAAVFACPPTSSAIEPPFDASESCPTYGEQQICTAQVPSWDGTPLDVDVTRPLNESSRQRHPLIVMLHGFGNDKHEWQSLTDEGDGSDKLRWNSHWFAKHGYYVLTYTARGFRSRRGSGHEPQTPPGSSQSEPNGRIRLKSIESEVKDTQHLAALTAASFPSLDPKRVAVTGGSYGGGESWLQASQATWSSQPESGLPQLSLQAAIPKYPWTDLAYSLAPHGHPGPLGTKSPPDYPGADPIYESAYGDPPTPGERNPVGVPKLSYIDGLSATGQRSGVFERATPPSNQASTTEGQIDIPAWLARVTAGDPTPDGDPTLEQIRRGLTKYRSAYYQDWSEQEDDRKVAIYAIQGWTDDLFPALESFRMFKYLKRLDPRWPVEVEVADVGHSRAQNKPETWLRINGQAFQFLQSHINGSHEQETTVSSQPTICANDGQPDRNETAARRLTAQTPEGLAAGRLTVGFPGSSLPPHSGTGDPNGPATDPVFGPVFDQALFGNGGGCRLSPGPATGGAYTAVSQPLREASTYVGLGSVKLPYTFLGQSGTVNARVWDVPPTGRPVLMTRGTYRLDAPVQDSPGGVLRLPLFGNHWPLEPGHRIRLDLAQVDEATFRRSNLGGDLTFSDATLELPTREEGNTSLAGDLGPTP